ncbi:hypothetical protein [Rhodovulum sp. PH10]|uniref:hypothetical protein n=1 Tax=Rhodovulum sp. PH10 TaxID=1187851 RepID=UPI00058C9B1A|nr:hypothetical protein [Rhodovulum sp. PH10]
MINEMSPRSEALETVFTDLADAFTKLAKTFMLAPTPARTQAAPGLLGKFGLIARPRCPMS